jgi:hypothetical protein
METANVLLLKHINCIIPSCLCMLYNLPKDKLNQEQPILNVMYGSLVQFVLGEIIQHAKTAGDDAVDVALAAEAMNSWKGRTLAVSMNT